MTNEMKDDCGKYTSYLSADGREDTASASVRVPNGDGFD